MINKILLAALLTGMCGAGWGQETSGASKREPFPHYSDKQRGWHFKELLPDPEEEQPPEQPRPAAPPPSPATASPPAPKPLSSAWIKEKLPQYLEAAIDDPSPENVAAYHYLQKFAMDASERFARQYQRVALGDPNLDGMVTRPTWNTAGFAFDDAAEKNTSRTLKALSQEYGLWFFFRSDCEACHIELPALQAFAYKYGFTVLPISIDGKGLEGAPFTSFQVDRGQANMLGVEYTPAIFMVKPPNTFMQVTQGLVSASELETRVLELGNQAGVIPDDVYNLTRGDRKVLLPPPAKSSLDSQKADSDPAYVREEIKRMMKKK